MDCEHTTISNELVDTQILSFFFLFLFLHRYMVQFQCLEDHEDVGADSLAKLRPANQHIPLWMWHKCGWRSPPQHI